MVDNIYSLSLFEIEKSIREGRKFWFLSCFNDNVIQSQIYKMFSNQGTKGFRVSFHDEELSKNVEGNAHLNAFQGCDAIECFLTKEAAIKYLSQQQTINN